MAFMIFLLAVAGLGAVTSSTPQQTPARQPHCTFGEEDLPLVLALDELDRDGLERLRVAPETRLHASEASRWLWTRHRQGHGGWPDPTETKTLVELGLGACAPHVMDALFSVAMQAPRAENLLDRYEVARLLELNGRFSDAERLLMARFDPAEVPKEDLARREYGEFLARRGRFAEALPLIEEYHPGWFLCGIGSQHYAQYKFRFIELCCDGVDQGACDDTLFQKRFDLLGFDGLAEYVAQRALQKGRASPAAESRAWFQWALRSSPHSPEEAAWMTERFELELMFWKESRTRHGEPRVDWNDAGTVERSVAQALEIVGTQPEEACSLLSRAVDRGAPVVGRAVLQLVQDHTNAWTADDREYLMAAWRDAILTRTYGYADPENPATW